MKTVSQKPADYLGHELFEMYKERHPDISVDTDVVEVRREYVKWGFQVPEPQQNSAYYMSPTAMIKVITIKPEHFELWALSKNDPYFQLAFVEQLNRLYVATLE